MKGKQDKMNAKEIIKNFRDVGKAVNTIAGKKLFPEKLIYRSGSLNNVHNHEDIKNIPTVLNLRSSKDEQRFSCKYIHVPAENKIENYETNNKIIKKWINKVIAKLVNPEMSLPVLIHCTSGKDRTGVVTAVILKAFNISNNIIIKEYLLSDGADDPRPMKNALNGIGNIGDYLKGNSNEILYNKLYGYRANE